MITADRLKILYTYNPENGLFMSTFTRRQWKAGRVAGNRAKYTMIVIDRKQYRAHRLAWLYMTGQWPDGQIDHINGDKHDNRFSNLRVATPAMNSQNILSPRKDCRSGLKGVSWRETHKKWHATIRINGKATHLGYFDSADAAHQVYMMAKQQHHSIGRSL
jgi:hypothetical protein